MEESTQGKKRTVAPLKLFGKENTPETWAMANMNMIIHDMEGQIEIGDTFKNPKFRNKLGKLRTFDRDGSNRDVRACCEKFVREELRESRLVDEREPKKRQRDGDRREQHDETRRAHDQDVVREATDRIRTRLRRERHREAEHPDRGEHQHPTDDHHHRRGRQ